MGEVIHVLNIMKCMDSDIMYIINVYNDIWNATKTQVITVLTSISAKIRKLHKFATTNCNLKKIDYFRHASP